MPDALRLDGVHSGYGEVVVLEDVSVSLPKSGSLAILGRNGAGKTTLLATVMGYTTLTAGRVECNGHSISKLRVYERSRFGIGYVPQERCIFPSLTVEENLTVAARPGRWNKERVYDLLPRLAERRSHMGDQISGGEQQMLAIGRALVGNPTLLLMDEPLEGLAPIIIDTLVSVLRRLIGEDALSVVLVEHHAKIALSITDNAIVLNRGRVAYHGSSATLLEDSARLTNLILAQ